VNVPPAEAIEGAIDNLKAVPAWIAKDQRGELTSAVGEDAAKKLGITFPLTADMEIGYDLGLAVARRMVTSSVALQVANIKPDEVL
jgi:hypothetical protein